MPAVILFPAILLVINGQGNPEPINPLHARLPPCSHRYYHHCIEAQKLFAAPEPMRGGIATIDGKVDPAHVGNVEGDEREIFVCGLLAAFSVPSHPRPAGASPWRAYKIRVDT